MKIGELARRSGTQVATIRFYESKGLLHPPARSVGNYRLYTTDHAERLLFIRRCRTLDMSLEEIRSLLHFKDSPTKLCGDVNVLLDAHIGHVVTRIHELQMLEQQLQHLRARCHAGQDSAHCGILRGLSDPSPDAISVPGSVLGARSRVGTHGV
jgi:Cd(II)/Pb(II)-responsive transcriptional regulator